MFDNLAVVLVRTKYPENVGSVARACLNFGCRDLRLVAPGGYDPERALPLATVHARHILESAIPAGDLSEVLSGFTAVYGTTARTGGWRKGLVQPPEAAEEIVGHLSKGGRVALVFGPEDKGLTNEETLQCHRLVTIPTHREGTSLNLAQAALILLYECQKARYGGEFRTPGPPTERLATHQERETLLAAIQRSLLAIDFVKQDNLDYWMLPVRRLLSRFAMRRNEFNLLMGVCRQIQWAVTGSRPKGEKDRDADSKDDVDFPA